MSELSISKGPSSLLQSFLHDSVSFAISLPGKVSTDKVYVQGRYAVGPDYTFLKYQADAHLEHLENVAVFSDGGADSVGLSFLIDVDFTYFLKEDEIGELHKDLAK